ncbi:AAA family ATPase [Actinopolymorpha pittospori]|uniref:Kinase n=1 Tax=Actinopolymorpha pittospori TaxID=648752 RepID=A0A927MQZ4_9ACTN|nr:ATP-binding protein [Actinopolymorpha pittospori]MBE1604484.1 putative kinase [Actinopolymorpha pittospori]
MLDDLVANVQTRRPTMYVMVGLPGAGKTVLARELEVERQTLRLTPDEWMIPIFGEPEAGGKRDVLEGRFVWLAIRALHLGMNVILDFGVWGKDERSALRALAADAGANCELVYLAVDEAEQRRRIRVRFADAPGSTFEMSDDDLDTFRRQFQVPNRDELTSSQIDQPPAGYSTWKAWASERWPSSTS